MKGTSGRSASAALKLGLAALAAGFFVWVFGLQALPHLRIRRAADPAPDRAATAAPAAAAAPAVRDAAPPEYHVLEVREARVGTAGGSLALPAGQGALDVPPAALDHEQTLRATLLAGPAGELAVDLAPDGLALQRPAALTLAVPAGWTAPETEIAVFDPARAEWITEADQVAGAAAVTAHIAHFSLRRVRIRPGMNFPFDPRRARGTFFLESDPDQAFEQFAEGRWNPVNRRAPAYRELVKQGRLGRHDLIASGRLRAVAGPERDRQPVSDGLRAVMLDPRAPEARTGWVRLVRLDGQGRETTFSTVARVIAQTEDRPADPARAVLPMSRAAMEALGLAWGEDFGTDPTVPDRTWIRIRVAGGASPLPYVPLRVEPWQPDSGPRS
jgi:hypothetical protein